MLRAALTAGLTHIACVQADTRQGESFAAPGAASGHSTAMQVAQAYRDQPEPPEALEPVPGLPLESEVFELPPVTPLGTLDGGTAVQANDFVFEGNTVVSRDELLQVVGPLRGRVLGAAELDDLRQAISRYYIDKGYITSGALLPADFYRDGKVHFQIVEGRIDRLRLEGLGLLQPFYLRNRLLREGEVFNANELQERFQQLLSDPLISRMNARLAPGAAPGAADLDVRVTRARPWQAAVFYNNHRSPSTGSKALGANLTLRNLTSLGDALDLRAQGHDAPDILYSADWSSSLYWPELLLQARYDRGRSSVIEEPVNRLDIKSTIQSKEAALTWQFVNRLARQASVSLKYSWRRNETFLLGEPFSFVAGEDSGISRVRTWRLEPEYIARGTRGALALRSTLALGHTNTVGSELSPEVIAPARYLFWIGQLQASWLAHERVGTVVLRLNGQWSRDRLVPLERFSVGGVHSVRGYRENQLVRDEGYAASLELRHALLDDAASGWRLVVVPFLDYGAAANRHEPWEKISSGGVGLVLRHGGMTAEVYYGKRFIKPDPVAQEDLQDKGLHFQLRYEWQ